jgi:hypothetical protein
MTVRLPGSIRVLPMTVTRALALTCASALLAAGCGGGDEDAAPATPTAATDATTPATEAPVEPTEVPTVEATAEPTASPTDGPSEEPSAAPTLDLAIPTPTPTGDPTEAPTAEPTQAPTDEPTPPPTDPPLPSEDDEQEGTGEPVFQFDEAGALVCANAEYALDAADNADDGAYADVVADMADWAGQTEATNLADLAEPVIDAPSAAEGRDAVITLLEACADAGYSL